MKKFWIILTSVFVGAFIFLGFHSEQLQKVAQQTQDEEVKVLGNDLIAQPQGIEIVVFNSVRLKKKSKYIITITGHLSPELSNHSWGTCNETEIQKIIRCGLSVTNPFSGETLQSTGLPEFNCTAEHLSDFNNSCVAPNQFQVQFILPVRTNDEVLQVHLKNNQSKISFHQQCGTTANNIGSFELPVRISSDTRMQVVRVPVE